MNTEFNYSNIEKEALVIVWTTNSFYLEKNFIWEVIIDH